MFPVKIQIDGEKYRTFFEGFGFDLAGGITATKNLICFQEWQKKR